MLTYYFKRFKDFAVFSIFFFAGLVFSQNTSTPLINVVYPWEGKNIGNVSKSFVFGNVSPYVSTITINGIPVNVYKNGTFIAYVDVSISSPAFVIDYSSGNLKATYIRNVSFDKKTSDFSKENPFEILSSTYVEIRRGFDVCVKFKGYNNSTVSFSIKGLIEAEIKDDGKGNFEKCLDIKDNTKTGLYDLILKYKDGNLKGKKMVFKDFLNVKSNFFLVVSSTDNVILKNDYGGYMIFLPPDVELICNLYELSRFRCILDNKTLWVDSSKVVLKKEIEKPPKSSLSLIKNIKNSQSTVLSKIYVSKNSPFSIWEDEKRLFVEIYNTIPNINWIVYDPYDEYTDYIYYRQVYQNTTLISYKFKDDIWGYDAYYSDDGTLNLEIKFRPFVAYSSTKPLNGLKVIVDPGHSPKNTPPYDGAVGPSQSYEYAVNLEIANKVKEKLLAYGADVIMTRTTNNENEQVPLQERPRIAKRYKGDIYVSIHANAIPDGEDPFSKPRGFQIYYYHLHSKKLAEKIHDNFLKTIPLPDEGFRFGDYMVARITQMPSVLVENAYLILPEQEDMLKDPLWQERFAQGIVNGIIDFIKE